jgi:triacylglycerol lipase
MLLGGQTASPGVPTRGGGVASAKLRLNDKTQRTVAGQFNGETVVGLAWPWPFAESRTTVLELTY